MDEIRYYRQFPDASTELSLGQAAGTPHFRASYELGRVSSLEKIEADGTIAEKTLFRQMRDFTQERYFKGQDSSTGVGYALQHGTDAAEKVLFDTNGNVIYPVKTKPSPEKVEVLARVTLHKDLGTDHFLDSLAGQNVELYLPRSREFFSFDHRNLMREINKRSITPSVAHSYHMDVTDPDFLGNIAWIRGNYGVGVITIHPSTNNYAAVMGALHAKADDIQAIGAKLSFENLEANDRWLKYPEQIMDMGLPFVSCTLDLSHLPAATDLEGLADRLAQYISVVHLSNQSGGKTHLPYRKGEMHIEEFLQRLKSNGFTGKFVLEYSPGHTEEKREDARRIRRLFS